MPFGDRTGPLGLGPRTGRVMGYCAGFGCLVLRMQFREEEGLGLAGEGLRWFGRGRGWRMPVLGNWVFQDG